MFKEATTLNYTLGLEHLNDFRILSRGVWFHPVFPQKGQL